MATAPEMPNLAMTDTPEAYKRPLGRSEDLLADNISLRPSWGRAVARPGVPPTSPHAAATINKNTYQEQGFGSPTSLTSPSESRNNYPAGPAASPPHRASIIIQNSPNNNTAGASPHWQQSSAQRPGPETVGLVPTAATTAANKQGFPGGGGGAIIAPPGLAVSSMPTGSSLGSGCASPAPVPGGSGPSSGHSSFISSTQDGSPTAMPPAPLSPFRGTGPRDGGSDSPIPPIVGGLVQASKSEPLPTTPGTNKATPPSLQACASAGRGGSPPLAGGAMGLGPGQVYLVVDPNTGMVVGTAQATGTSTPGSLAPSTPGAVSFQSSPGGGGGGGHTPAHSGRSSLDMPGSPMATRGSATAAATGSPVGHPSDTSPPAQPPPLPAPQASGPMPADMARASMSMINAPTTTRAIPPSNIMPPNAAAAAAASNAAAISQHNALALAGLAAAAAAADSAANNAAKSGMGGGGGGAASAQGPSTTDLMMLLAASTGGPPPPPTDGGGSGGGGGGVVNGGPGGGVVSGGPGGVSNNAPTDVASSAVALASSLDPATAAALLQEALSSGGFSDDVVLALAQAAGVLDAPNNAPPAPTGPTVVTGPPSTEPSGPPGPTAPPGLSFPLSMPFTAPPGGPPGVAPGGGTPSGFPPGLLSPAPPPSPAVFSTGSALNAQSAAAGLPGFPSPMPGLGAAANGVAAVRSGMLGGGSLAGLSALGSPPDSWRTPSWRNAGSMASLGALASPGPRTTQAAAALAPQGLLAGLASPPGPRGTGPKHNTLYKTEMCRSWTDTGSCRYGSKCQFAHGPEELRPVVRHPKYKTEHCRTFAATGVCQYGNRCRFIHSSSPGSSMGTPRTAALGSLTDMPSPLGSEVGFGGGHALQSAADNLGSELWNHAGEPGGGVRVLPAAAASLLSPVKASIFSPAARNSARHSASLTSPPYKMTRFNTVGAGPSAEQPLPLLPLPAASASTNGLTLPAGEEPGRAVSASLMLLSGGGAGSGGGGDSSGGNAWCGQAPSGERGGGDVMAAMQLFSVFGRAGGDETKGLSVMVASGAAPQGVQSSGGVAGGQDSPAAQKPDVVMEEGHKSELAAA